MKITRTISGSPDIIARWVERYMANLSIKSGRDYSGNNPLRITPPKLKPLPEGWQMMTETTIADPARERLTRHDNGKVVITVTAGAEYGTVVEIECSPAFESLMSKLLLALLNRDPQPSPPAAAPTHWPGGEQVELQDEPWNKLKDNNYDRLMVRCLWQGLSDPEIARKINRDKKTVTTRLSTLRKFYGPKIIPYRKDLKKPTSYD